MQLNIPKSIENKNSLKFDGHIHLFSNTGEIIKFIPEKWVGFMDIEYDKITKFTAQYYYEKFISKYLLLDGNYIPENNILLATSWNFEEIKTIIENYHFLIRGIGELKLYNTYNGYNIGYHDLNLIASLLYWNEKRYNLPVYIHYDLNNIADVKKFIGLIKSCSDTYFILCHMGICNDGANSDFIIKNHIFDTLLEYDNLYFDVSWGALRPLIANKIFLSDNTRSNRLIWGSDWSCRSENAQKNNKQLISSSFILYAKAHLMPFLMESDNNICSIFNLKK